MRRAIHFLYGYLLFMTVMFSYAEPLVLNLQNPKKRTLALDPLFIKNMAHMFGATIFIETGTFCGATAYTSAQFFNEVHTIELHDGLYLRSLYNLSDQKNVRVYHGDSSVILPAILPHLSGNLLFWLDGHWNGDSITACGNKTTPILEELAAIAHSGNKNAIILIDDLRAFEGAHDGARAFLSDYPTVYQLRDALLAINQEYKLCVIGDMILAYPPIYDIVPSPLVDALTRSRFFDPTRDNVQELIALEKETIGYASDNEMEILQGMFEDFCPHKLGKDYALWYGLVLLRRGFAQEASGCFSIAIDLSKSHGCDHWRLHWYKAQADMACGHQQGA